ncbi:hypothetical protein LX36DRAFT_185 [Colletotrichum falcatum]|nr:hypothetical protein LX36DRAFT_185 [Colletotrichum falcatum]
MGDGGWGMGEGETKASAGYDDRALPYSTAPFPACRATCSRILKARTVHTVTPFALHLLFYCCFFFFLRSNWRLPLNSAFPSLPHSTALPITLLTEGTILTQGTLSPMTYDRPPCQLMTTVSGCERCGGCFNSAHPCSKRINIYVHRRALRQYPL